MSRFDLPSDDEFPTPNENDNRQEFGRLTHSLSLLYEALQLVNGRFNPETQSVQLDQVPSREIDDEFGTVSETTVTWLRVSPDESIVLNSTTEVTPLTGTNQSSGLDLIGELPPRTREPAIQADQDDNPKHRAAIVKTIHNTTILELTPIPTITTRKEVYDSKTGDTRPIANTIITLNDPHFYHKTIVLGLKASAAEHELFQRMETGNLALPSALRAKFLDYYLKEGVQRLQDPETKIREQSKFELDCFPTGLMDEGLNEPELQVTIKFNQRHLTDGSELIMEFTSITLPLTELVSQFPEFDFVPPTPPRRLDFTDSSDSSAYLRAIFDEFQPQLVQEFDAWQQKKDFGHFGDQNEKLTEILNFYKRQLTNQQENPQLTGKSKVTTVNSSTSSYSYTSIMRTLGKQGRIMVATELENPQSPSIEELKSMRLLLSL